MDSLIKTYRQNKNDDLELEIRSSTNWVNFLQFLTKHKQTQANVITSFVRSGNNVRHESWYNNGKKQNDSIMIKTQLASFFDKSKGIKVALSTERISKRPATSIDYAALKFRIQFTIGEWSYEPTVILELKHNDISVIKESIANMFVPGKKTITEFYDLIMLNNMGKNAIYNLEAEWRSDAEPTVDDINTAIGILTSTVEDTGGFASISRLIFPKQREYNTLKELLNNAIGLNRLNINTLSRNLDNYLVSEKNDGETCLLLVSESGTTVVTALSTEIPDNIQIVMLGEKMPKEIVLYDVLYHRETTTGKTYTERLDILNSIVSDLDLKKVDNLTIRLKKVLPARTGMLSVDTEGKNSSNSSNKTDGLIFTENVGYSYAKIWKYKPISHNTIDFLLIKVEDSLTALYPNALPKRGKNTNTYVLCSTISDRDYKLLGLEQLGLTNWDSILQKQLAEHYLAIKDKRPIPFRPALDTECFIYSESGQEPNRNLQICEFKYIPANKPGDKWQLITRREDREIGVKTGTSYGNYYKTAEDIFFNYFDPISLADIGKQQLGYFQTEKKQEYRDMIGFNNFVKYNVMQQLQNTTMIVDLSSGKGQDLVTYNGIGVKCGKFIDIDSLAVANLLDRRYSLSDPKIYKYGKIPATNMLVTAGILDLNEPWEENSAYIRETGLLHNPKAVICNLAIHYLIPDGFNNIFRLVDSLLEKGGKFIFSTFCGEKIRDQLAKDNGEITFNTERYSIKYADEKQQKISVKLPFSQGEYYDEYLVNVTDLIEYFVDKRYKLLQRVYFDEYRKQYKKTIDPADIGFSGLYVFVTLIKN